MHRHTEARVDADDTEVHKRHTQLPSVLSAVRLLMTIPKANGQEGISVSSS